MKDFYSIRFVIVLNRKLWKPASDICKAKVIFHPFFSILKQIDYLLIFTLAYKECYGDEPVWKQYRRNHKGLIPPEKTRKACIVSIQNFGKLIACGVEFPLILIKFAA